MPTLQLRRYTEEEALGRVLSYLRAGNRGRDTGDGWASSYDLYIPAVINSCFAEQQTEWLQQHPSPGMTRFEHQVGSNDASFYSAAWSLCTRGILHPAKVEPPPQPQFAPVVGAGFFLTSYGRTWLKQAGGYESIPLEPTRFSSHYTEHAARFGPGYHSRSQEAVRCYIAHTYLACCVMCGAASESILLALAIAKTGDEDKMLSEYRTNTGQKKMESLLLSQANSYEQQELRNYTTLLKYWRDTAAHGLDTRISEGEAFTSLLLLLRFAQFASDRWGDLTGKTS